MFRECMRTFSRYTDPENSYLDIPNLTRVFITWYYELYARINKI